MQALHRHGPLIGRILIALIFILSGFSKIGGFAATSGYIASKGLPLPYLVTILTIIIELGGGLLIVVGYRARLAAAALFLFTLAAAFLFHDFWAASPDMAQNQMIHFMKNISMAGGLLFVLVHGSGPHSVKAD